MDDARIPFQGDSDSKSSGFWGITKEEQSAALSKYHVDHKGYDDGSYSGNRKTTNRKPREENTVFKTSGFKSENNDTAEASPLGRFAANLLVSDDVLNDGKVRKSVKSKTFHSGYESDNVTGMIDGISHPGNQYSDEGTFSRYYDLDAWWESRIQELPLDVQATYPFMIVPKASKSEKNMGLDTLENKIPDTNDFKNLPSARSNTINTSSGKPRNVLPSKNFHPTVKPISLMSYLVTLGSREDDLVLDPFVGSGTTCIAAKLLNRKYIGMEMDSEYVVIAQERIKAHKPEEATHVFF